MFYGRHGQSAALGPFYNQKFGQKISIKAEIVTLSSIIWNNATRDGKLFSNLARDQKSLATLGPCFMGSKWRASP